MLLLRKECQKALDSMKLNMMHVEFKNKAITIVGECGKPFVQINSIRLAKATVSKDEREYAVRLFNEFIRKYEDKITNLVNLRRILKDTPEPILPYNGHLKYDSIPNTKFPYTYSKKAVLSLSLINERNETISISVSNDGVRINSLLKFDSIGDNISTIQKHLKEARLCIDEIDKYDEIKSEISKLEIEISTCTI